MKVDGVATLPVASKGRKDRAVLVDDNKRQGVISVTRSGSRHTVLVTYKKKRMRRT